MNDIISNQTDTNEDIKKSTLYFNDELNCNYTPLFFNKIDSNPLEKLNLEKVNFIDDNCTQSGTIAVCLTAYNEKIDSYKISLQSLFKSAQYYIQQDKEVGAKDLIICIMVDGMDTMDPLFAEYAKNLGIYDPYSLDLNAEYHLFEALIPHHIINSKTALNDARNSNDPTLQKVVLFIKNKNHGKLHSHKCFFEIICNLYTPEYFLQIDVGTSPEESAIYLMWKHLDENQNIAATAARSHLPSPTNPLDLIAVWQFCDIALERIINWPTEILMGNLSVLPGQLSLTRMKSITTNNSSNQRSPKVLDNYYKGLDKLDPLEANMYLAEDRVLGLEMVFQNKNQWELGYETRSEATVDACETWGELLKQRRRWICSSIACRISMLSRMKIIFSNNERSLIQKSHKIISGFYSIIFSLFCWFVPTFHLTIQTTLSMSAQQFLTSSTMSTAANLLWILCCLSFIPQIFFSIRRKLNLLDDIPIAISIYIQTANIIFCSSILVANANLISGAQELIIAFSTMVIGYSLLCLFYSKKLFLQLIKNVVQYSLCRPVVASFLMLYSIINCHDTSWGTKGLELQDNSQKSLKETNSSFRLKTVTLFVSTNLLLFYLFLISGIVNNIYSIVAIISITLVQIIISIVALAANNFILKNNKILKKENKVTAL